jgi:hypothetical protein
MGQDPGDGSGASPSGVVFELLGAVVPAIVLTDRPAGAFVGVMHVYVLLPAAAAADSAAAADFAVVQSGEVGAAPTFAGARVTGTEIFVAAGDRGVDGPRGGGGGAAY